MNNNYDFEMNNNLRGIERNTHKLQETMADKLFLELYGKERYLEYVEKRKFRRTLIYSGFGAFLVGFFGVGLYACNWNMNVFIEKCCQFFMNLF